MIKKIKLLTKIFLKDYYQQLNIIKNNKLNKKSIFTWLLIILIFALSYLSLEIISFLQKIRTPILFLKVYLPIISIIMIMQLITLTCKIFYYSKDLEYIMPLPFKKTEILIGKLNTVITIMYFLEMLYLLVPLLMYGILEAKTILFFVWMIITIIFLPIFFTTVISILMLFCMKLAKFIKNQDLFQFIIESILTLIIVFGGMTFVENIIFKQSPESLTGIQKIEVKVDEINNGFLVINPLLEILQNNNFINKTFNLLKIIMINLIPIIIFILLGKKLYLKNILQNKNTENKKRKCKYKNKNKIIEYVKKDIKKLIKNPTYFMQYIFQYLSIAIVCVMLLSIFIPLFIEQMKEEVVLENMLTDDFKFQSILIVLGLLQIIFTFSNLSITAISREGKNAIFMKYIPVSLYKQFKIKTVPQTILNIIVILMIIYIFYLKIPQTAIEYFIIGFIMAMILNVINSYIMLIIDLKRPNLNWINEESISKNNGNKLYQYIITIFICLILKYISSILEGTKFIVSIICTTILLLIILLLLEIYIKNNINKLFKKIN